MRVEADEATEALNEAAAAIRSRTRTRPEAAVILGTGLGGAAREIPDPVVIPYAEIPHFPSPSADTHEGRLLIGELGGRLIAALQGRFHRYEGYTLRQITFPVRVLALLGARSLIVSNAGGGLNPLWQAGDVVLIDDHLNLLGGNPLAGPNLDALGPRFPDLSEPYDRELGALAESVALEAGFPLRRGVYAAVTGPNLETRAEYRMLRALGADVVGMSTVPEVIVARHMGMRVLGLSIITDACLPDALEPVDIDTIIRTARTAEPRLTYLITEVLRRWPGGGSKDA